MFPFVELVEIIDFNPWLFLIVSVQNADTADRSSLSFKRQHCPIIAEIFCW